MKYYIITGIICVFYLFSFLLNKKTDFKQNILLLLPFPIVHFLLLYGTWEMLKGQGNGEYTAFLISCLVFGLAADVALFFAIRTTENNAAMREKNRQMTELLELQENHYTSALSDQDEMKEIKRDISEEIATVKGLLEKDRQEEVTGALDAWKMRQKTRTDDGGIIGSFIEQRRRAMDEKGIMLKSSIRLPGGRSISDVDLICAIGNILDNAEEACVGLENPVVELSVERNGQYICIGSRNPMPKETTEKKQRRISSLDRGMGLTILEELAHRLDGEMKILRLDGQFSVTLFLKEDVTNDQYCAV